MSWNYRQGGSWNAPTIKRRENGAWVSIGGGGGGGGGEPSGEFGWVDPPTRSTTESVNDVYGNDLQTALDGASSDTELLLDNGPYVGEYNLPTTNQLTLSGGSDTSNPTVIEHSGSNDRMFFFPGESYTTTSGSNVSLGDSVISVGDASIFSVGDTLRIHKANEGYRLNYDAPGSTDLAEFHTVEAVDTSANTVTIEESVSIKDYGSCDIQRTNWGVESIHFHNIDFTGTDGSTTATMTIAIGRWLWWTDCEFRGMSKEGAATSEGAAIKTSRAMDMYVRDCTTYGGDTGTRSQTSYGIAFSASKRLRVLRNEVRNTGRYNVAGGHSPQFNPAQDIWSRDPVQDGSGFLYDGHWGSEDHVCEGGRAFNGSGSIKLRGYLMETRDIEADLAGDDNGFSMTQKPTHCTTSKVHMMSPIWMVRVWSKDAQDYHDITWTDCWMETPVNGFLHIRSSNSGAAYNLSQWTFDHVALDGTWMTESNWESNSNVTSDLSSSNIDFTFNYPSDGTTPSEYFSGMWS